MQSNHSTTLLHIRKIFTNNFHSRRFSSDIHLLVDKNTLSAIDSNK